jgi:late competence protein required for DNA uptake (superfamily II DNA/RNA helicase)
MPNVWWRFAVVPCIIGFFVPPSGVTEEQLDIFTHNVEETIHTHVWVISAVRTGWTYTEIMNMPEGERIYWFEKCEEELQQLRQQEEEMNSRSQFGSQRL